jgi:hypothetical protein
MQQVVDDIPGDGAEQPLHPALPLAASPAALRGI